MERVLVTLHRAPAYFTTTGAGNFATDKRADELLFTNDIDAEDAVSVVAERIAFLIESEGTLVFGDKDLKQVFSFKQHVSAAVTEAPESVETMATITLSDLLGLSEQ